MCLGFWVGLMCSLVFYGNPLHTPWTITYGDVMAIEWRKHFIHAITSSGVTWMFCAITQNALWGKVLKEAEFNALQQKQAAKQSIEPLKKEVELHG